VRWFFACAIAVVVAGSAGLVYLAQRGGTSQAAPPPDRFTAAATWAAGKRPAPSFSLRDLNGKPISMSSLRGHPVVVTFIDPVCRNLCPIEARVLSAATAKLPAKERPTIVAVSVNPWANTKANFAADRVHWKLGPNWRWAVGTRAQLTRIWHQYEIDVLLNSKTINGITVHEVVHTEASYVVDGSGFERAVYIYPFSGSDLAQEVRDVATS
jgi:cytochrome oxidase Cu insertion factor (SCO1/SenC/PrrC family)